MNSYQCYLLNLRLMAAGYVPCAIRDGRPLLRVSGMPTENEVRRWSGELGVTETGILDQGRVTPVTEVPTANQRRKEAERRARGAVPRSEWLKAHSGLKPWMGTGMSKSAWYRRQKAGGKGVTNAKMGEETP